MHDREISENALKEFIESVNRQRLLYLWTLRAKSIEVNNDEILKLEVEVYPDIPNLRNEGLSVLCQRDADELQLLLSLADTQDDSTISHTKAQLYKLEHTTVRMWKEENHQRPHFHVKHRQQFGGSYAIDTLEKLAGSIPPKYEKPILAWAAKHRESLKLTWDKLQAGEDIRELVSFANSN